MARPRQDPTQEPTATRILREAQRVFSEKGYDAASLTEIAAAVGLRAPSLLHHYASKEVLYDAVLEAFYVELSQTLSNALVAEVGRQSSVTQALLTVLANLEEPDRDLLVTIVAEVVHSGRGADVIANAVEPLVALITPLAQAELPHLTPQSARPLLLLASMLVLFSVPSARTPPSLERLRKLMWVERDQALALAESLLRGQP